MIVLSWSRADDSADWYDADSVEELCFKGDALATIANGADLTIVKVFKFDVIELATMGIGDIYVGRSPDGAFANCIICMVDSEASEATFLRILEDVPGMEEKLMHSINDFLNLHG
jgi:hypothetical protein